MGRADCFSVGTAFGSTKWLSLNPCGFFGISCSFAVHIFAVITAGTYLIAGSFFAQAVYVLLYLPLSFMALWSLFMAWTTDPGAVPMGARPLVTVRRAGSQEMQSGGPQQTRKRALARCQKCNDNFKPNRAHHDSVTGRCIVKFDHYCPWVCNAVGAMNHKFFVLFVFYTMNTCLTALVMIIARSIRCGHTYDNESADVSLSEKDAISNTTAGTTTEEEAAPGELDEGRIRRWLETLKPDTHYVHEECEEFYSTYSIIILFCVAITFLIFTACMMVEQIEAIQTNQGKIARMKMKVGRGGTELSRVTDEFNEMFGGVSPSVAWHWFIPRPVQFPGSMHKVVMGFEWDPTFDPAPYREPDDTSTTASVTSEPTGSTNDGGSLDSPPCDLETGLPTEDLDEVSLDASSSHSKTGNLKKRAVSSGSITPPVETFDDEPV